MENTSFLEKIPLEVLYCVFDHCDTYSIFHSIRLVCKHLRQAVDSYKPHKLDFSSAYRYDLGHIFRVTSLDSLTLLVISERKQGRISKCISLIGNHRLTRLRSLSLHDVSDKELQHFLENLVTNALISLSIKGGNEHRHRLPAVIAPAIRRFNLKRLCFEDFMTIVDHKSMPNHYSIEHLTIGSCLYRDYPAILNRMPQLRELVMGECKGSYDEFFSASDLKFQSSLIYLTINDCQLNFIYLQSLLSLTPTIRHLKLICDDRSFKSMFDGSQWEKFISSKLPLLNNFNFSFLHEVSKDENSPLLDQLIASFQTPFWFDKQWFVTCEYNIANRELRLYRSGMICVHKSILRKMASYSYEKESLVFKISSQENIYKLTQSNKVHEDDRNLIRTFTTTKASLSDCLKDNMQHMVKVIESDKTLTKLDLVLNKSGDGEMRHLARALSNNKTLISLSLCGNNIKNDGAKYMADVLEKNSTLIKLVLSRNDLLYGIEHIARGLRKNTTLRTLNIHDSKIIGHGMKFLGEALKINTTLVELDLSENKIGTDGTIKLADGLKTNKALTTLDLRNNNIGSEAGQHLGDLLRENTILRTLELSNNQIGSEGMKGIANGLQCNTALTRLNLQSNNIGSDAGECLSNVLRENKTLSILELDHNAIENEALKNIANGLQNNMALTKLSISYNKFGSDGVSYLAVALKQKTILTDLQLQNNNIKTSGAEYLADALEHNNTLLTLSLHSNGIGDHGARYLAAALRMNTRLTTLGITGNQIGNEGKRYLAAALKVNKTLTTLDLGYYGNSTTEKNQFIKILLERARH